MILCGLNMNRVESRIIYFFVLGCKISSQERLIEGVDKTLMSI